MKKITAGILTALMLVCFSVVAFAGQGGYRHNGDGYGHKGYRGHGPAMNETQRTEQIDFMEQRNKLVAEFLNKEVQAGRITQAVADARITLMNESLKMYKDNKFNQPLTDDAIKARQELADKMRELRIEQIKQSVTAGNLTKEQGDNMINRLQNNNYHGKGPKADYIGMMGGGYGMGHNYHNNADCPYYNNNTSK